MKLPKLEISRWYKTKEATTTMAYSIPDVAIEKYLLVDVMAQMNRKIASYMARRYIITNRERIENFVKHNSVRRHIEREINRLLRSEV